jgi:hypothetical protein
MEKLKIGIGHLVRGMQLAGFGHEEIMAVRQYLIDTKGVAMGQGKSFGFVDDCYSREWDDNPFIIDEIAE